MTAEGERHARSGPGQEGAHSDRSVRRAYVAAVERLAERAARMLAQGRTEEEVARAVHGLRRELGEEFKARTSPARRARLRERNLAVYGDPCGPTVESLRALGKSWTQIITSASRPGRTVPGGPPQETAGGGPEEASGTTGTRNPATTPHGPAAVEGPAATGPASAPVTETAGAPEDGGGERGR